MTHKRQRLWTLWRWPVLGLLLAGACGTRDLVADGPDAGRAPDKPTAGPLPGGANGDGGTRRAPVGRDGGREDRDAAMACATQSQEAELEPVYLLFAFDVSGSMGKGDKPWHDRSLKWDPVVAATRAFFEHASSQGLSASLTFFPAEGGEDARCQADSYRDPDVAMAALPSDAFGQAMDAIGAADWRGGTPTLHVLDGLFDQIDARRDAQPGRYVVVLVTDGYPQDCPDSSIDAVAALVQGHAGDVPTYVIGVENPPVVDAPDTTSNLAQVAQAGGTDMAYLIDTGDPGLTVARFTETIDAIRGASIACEAAIPQAPAGRVFDKTRVSVSAIRDGQAESLDYDTNCESGDGWHYDDPDTPAQIVVCPGPCGRLQGKTAAALRVAFECEQVILAPL